MVKKKTSKIKFNKGDYVVYPSYGPGKILGIKKEIINGKRIQVLIISINERVILRIPVEKITDLGVRKLSTANRLKDAMLVLKAKAKKKRKTMWSRRAQEYEAKILSGNLVSIAEVLKELYKKDSFEDSSFSEKQIYASALDRLSRELAAMKKLDKEAATKELENILKSAA
jgi:CarD family transcriptional regulator